MMGIHNLPTTHSYWGKNIVFSNWIPVIFSRDYFLLLLKALYLYEEYVFPDENKFNDEGDNYENSILEKGTYKNDSRLKIKF